MGTNPVAAPVVKSYEYPAGPSFDPPVWSAFASLTQETPASNTASVAKHDFTESCTAQDLQRIQKELQDRFETGRQLGFNEGRKAEQETQSARFEAAAERYRSQLAGLVQKFDVAHERYLREVEQEVVELALVIAARVLRREAQLDPLMLTGAVRVALGQLSKTTKVQLRVAKIEAPLWVEAIAHVPNLVLRPDVIADEEMRPGDCLVETELGSADLSVRAQLAEMERGLFDRTAGTEEPARRGSLPPTPNEAAL